MADNLGSFTAAIDEFTEEELPKKHAEFTQKIAMQALRSLVLKTPVDTGRARANWNTTIESPDPGDSDQTDKPGGTTIGAGAAVIQRVDPFQTIWIANGLPYIEALEDGHSTQAPQGMVKLTMAELRSQFE